MINNSNLIPYDNLIVIKEVRVIITAKAVRVRMVNLLRYRERQPHPIHRLSAFNLILSGIIFYERSKKTFYDNKKSANTTDLLLKRGE